MKFKLYIDCEGAAFDGDPTFSVQHILSKAALDQKLWGPKGLLRDYNGNTVGFWEYSDDTKVAENSGLVPRETLDEIVDLVNEAVQHYDPTIWRRTLTAIKRKAERTLALAALDSTLDTARGHDDI